MWSGIGHHRRRHGPETGRVELVAHAVEDGSERWRTTIVSDPTLWLIGHRSSSRREGGILVIYIYTEHLLSQSLQPVSIGAARLAADGELQLAGVLTVDSLAAKMQLPQIDGALGPCDTLWVWDARAGVLRKFQL